MSKDGKAILSIVLWIIGSMIIGGFLHSLSSSGAMDWLIIILVIGLAVFCMWLYSKL